MRPPSNTSNSAVSWVSRCTGSPSAPEFRGIRRTGGGRPCHDRPGTPLGPAAVGCPARDLGLALERGAALRRLAQRLGPAYASAAPGLLPERYRRKRPYIYSDAEIEGIVERRAGSIPCGAEGSHVWRPSSAYSRSPACASARRWRLDREDVDLQEGVLRVRRTKFGKSRLVVVHESTRQALADYASQRDRVVHRPATPAFFLYERGVRVRVPVAEHYFAKVSREIGLRPATTGGRRGRGPRLHDLRASLCRPYPGRLVSGGDRCREGDAETDHLSGTHACVRDVLVHRGRPGTAGAGGAEAGKPGGVQAMKPSTNLSGLVQAFFTDRLLRQRKASPHTVAGYRDTFRLLLRFAAQRLGKVPSRLSLGELDAPFVGEFLDHLEKEHGSRHGAATRTWRRSIPSSSTCRSRSRPAPTSAAASSPSPASGTSGD